MKAKLSQAAMAAMTAARGLPEQPQVVRQLFAEAKRHYSIPSGQRIYANIDDASAADYGVIYRKKTNTPYEVPDRLVPTYTLPEPVGSFVRVHGAEALAVLASTVKEYGAVWMKTAPADAGWAGTFIADYKRYKVLVMYVDGQYRFIAFSDALALLSMLGELADVQSMTEVPAGVLVAGDYLLIPT